MASWRIRGGSWSSRRRRVSTEWTSAKSKTLLKARGPATGLRLMAAGAPGAPSGRRAAVVFLAYAFAALSPSALGFFSLAGLEAAFAALAAFAAAAVFSALAAAAASAFSTLGDLVGGVAYFFLNPSMRPCVSISFFLPVEKGWQLAQIARWRSPPVERVSQTAPQAHWIFAVG